MEEYRLGGHTYSFSYSELKRQYQKYVDLTDEEFMADLPHILHFTVFVCWFKQLQARDLLSDIGLIHELVHLLTLDNYADGVDEEQGTSLGSIRAMFNETCRLA